MNELKRYTIKTSYSTEVYICYDLEDLLAEICFCDAYEIIDEKPAAEKQPLFDKYFNMIPNEEFDFPSAYEYWKSRVLILLSGYYKTFDEMYNDSKF